MLALELGVGGWELGVDLVAPLEFTVPADFAGQRLDRFLVSVLAEHSRSQIQRLIADGRVIVPRGTAKPNLAMREGDTVAVDIPPPAPSELAG